MKQKQRKKQKKQVPYAKVFVLARFNNTHVCFSDKGQVLCTSSAGKTGFKGSKKSTAYAGQLAGTNAAKQAMEFGVKEVDVVIKGPGMGRESAVRGIQSQGIIIRSIEDRTRVPHNGCRARKLRRV